MLAGRYRLGSTLGAGQYGKAILCHDQEGKLAVVKQIHIGSLSQKEQEEAMHEVKVMQELEHLNIVHYIDCVQQDGMLYIIMEYCSQGELSALVANRARTRQPFTEQEIMFMFVQIALALWQVHSKNILHRDLKSQNIFIAEGNILKLGDFGIARVLHSDAELVKTAIGTPYYLSPEICQDQPYNRKSDCWALGCVLYELASLRRAFDGGSLPALVLKILKGKYPPLPAKYSSNLRALVDALLRQDPRARPSIDAVLRMDYVKVHLARYAQHVLKLTQQQCPLATNTGLARAVLAAGNATVAMSLSKPVAIPGSGVCSNAARHAAAVAAAVPASPPPAAAQALPAWATADSAAAYTIGAQAALAESNAVDSSTAELADRAAEKGSCPLAEPAVYEQRSQELETLSATTSSSSSIEKDEPQQQQQQQRGRGLLGTGWLDRQQAAWEQLAADMAASHDHAGRPRAAGAVAPAAAAAATEQHKLITASLHTPPIHALPAAVAATSALAEPSGRRSDGDGCSGSSRKQRPHNKPGSRAKYTPDNAGACKAQANERKDRHTADAGVKFSASPASVVAAAKAARSAQKAAWQQQQQQAAAAEAVRRATRAAELEAVHRDKAAAVQKRQLESAAAAAAHKQHMKAVQPRLTKEQLAELGAAFRHRLDTEFIPGAAAEDSASWLWQGQQQQRKEGSRTSRRSSHASSCGNSSANGFRAPSAAGSKTSTPERERASEPGGAQRAISAAADSHTKEESSKSMVAEAAAIAASLPPAAKAASTAAAKPWLAPRKAKAQQGPLLDVQIFCPYGSTVMEAEAETEQQHPQQQHQGAILAVAVGAITHSSSSFQAAGGVSIAVNAANSHDDDVYEVVGSPKMQQVLFQIHDVLAATPRISLPDTRSSDSSKPTVLPGQHKLPAGPREQHAAAEKRACGTVLGATVPGTAIVQPMAATAETVAPGAAAGNVQGNQAAAEEPPQQHDTLDLPPETSDPSSKQLLMSAVAALQAGGASLGTTLTVDGAAGTADNRPQKAAALRRFLTQSLGEDTLTLAYRYVEAMQEAALPSAAVTQACVDNQQLLQQQQQELSVRTSSEGGKSQDLSKPSNPDIDSSRQQDSSDGLPYEALLVELLGPVKLPLTHLIHKLLLLESSKP